jgi:hypothetical protein
MITSLQEHVIEILRLDYEKNEDYERCVDKSRFLEEKLNELTNMEFLGYIGRAFGRRRT